ncbi:Com family DNA-binding transcriptional regulator [Marinobacterium rhizophilum]|uniref:Com family DNA-binding transcriptional regulator n=1 Tax=Marinobacterium rhizophilum TaxID=420402 RepID=A0ABY5HLC3_9GAMM|nr:Com family DNA-binding transcriptional regulator [Marinobacterium rhizophilum]UTW12924.1 Com family DNA-binding transcriptional regulator [Marinobacterium rhizophilum]
MHDIRCSRCQKLLARAVFAVIEIKCPRCKTLNTQRAPSPLSDRRQASEQEHNRG